MKKSGWTFLGIGIALLCLGSVFTALKATTYPPVASHTLCSPDLQYSIATKADFFAQFIMRFPGQGSDSPGKVYVYDRLEKKYVASGHVPMMWMASDLKWDGKKAYFVGDTISPNILDPWILPRPVQADVNDQWKEATRLCNGKLPSERLENN